MVGLVTDNAENMNKTRKLVSEAHPTIVNYGCSAHQMNLLAKDLNCSQVVNKVTSVAKVFRNCHLPAAWLSAIDGATKAPLPSEVRWSSVVKTLEWYVKNWHSMKEIVSDNGSYFQNSQFREFKKTLSDVVVFQNVEDAIKVLSPVRDALNVMQRDRTTIADGVEIWKNSLGKFRDIGPEAREWLEKCETRYVAVPDVWYAANLLHPKYVGGNLSEYEMKRALEWVKSNHPECVRT